jgi:phosphatidate phosphatase PAH1
VFESPYKKCDFVVGAEMKRISYGGGLSKFEERCDEGENVYEEEKQLSHVNSLIVRGSDNEDEIDIKKIDKDSDESGDEDSLEKFNEVVDDASDEGLGDISSENESGSPQPGEERRKLSDHFLEQNKNMIKCANKFDPTNPFLDLNIEETKMLQDAKIPTSPSDKKDNRVPSMMPFETPL